MSVRAHGNSVPWLRSEGITLRAPRRPSTTRIGRCAAQLDTEGRSFRFSVTSVPLRPHRRALLEYHSERYRSRTTPLRERFACTSSHNAPFAPGGGGGGWGGGRGGRHARVSQKTRCGGELRDAPSPPFGRHSMHPPTPELKCAALGWSVLSCRAACRPHEHVTVARSRRDFPSIRLAYSRWTAAPTPAMGTAGVEDSNRQC